MDFDSLNVSGKLRRLGWEWVLYLLSFSFRRCSQRFFQLQFISVAVKMPHWGQVLPQSLWVEWDKGRLSGCSRCVPVRWRALPHSVCLKYLSLRWSICPYGWRHLSGLVSLFSWRKNASPATLNEGRWDDAFWQLRHAQQMAAGCAWCCWALLPCSAPSKDVHTSFIKTKRTQIGEMYRIDLYIHTTCVFFSLHVSLLEVVFHTVVVYMCIMYECIITIIVMIHNKNRIYLFFYQDIFQWCYLICHDYAVNMVPLFCGSYT